jgi:hypothetical protein
MTRKPIVDLRPHIAGWLNDLYLATVGGSQPIEDIKSRIAVMASALMIEFPEQQYFCRESLLTVSKQNNFFPGVAVISGQLAVWAGKALPPKPTSPEMIAPDDQSLSALDRHWIAFWQREPNAVLLSLIKSKAPPAFEWIVKNDNAAALIAIRHGWSEAQTLEHIREQVRADWSDPQAVMRSVHKVLTLEDGRPAPRDVTTARLLGMLRGIVSRHAPDNLALIPETV